MDVTEPAPLLPRYRRPLSFGGVLDETFRLYRSDWPRLMGITALCTLPSAIAIALFAGQAYTLSLDAIDLDGADGDAMARLFAGLTLGAVLATIVSVVATLVGQGGVTAMSGWLMRGERRSVGEALGVAFRKLLVMFGVGIVVGLAVLGLMLVAIPLYVIGVFGLLGGLIALIGLVVWVNRPEERRTNGLKWLIILATPFGLPIYYGVRWSLAIPAIFQERTGVMRSMRRSADLVEGRWFQVFGVWFVLGIVVSLLQAVPAAVIGFAAAAFGVNALDPEAGGLAVSIAQNAASIVGGVLFGALTFIAATIMFVDARNRREGADLAERIDLLQTGTPER